MRSLQFFVQPLQYFQLFFLSVVHRHFNAEHYLLPKTCLPICRLSGQVVGKCLESPETFVEIAQKLEVSNRTIRRSLLSPFLK
jgi:hypothetical protein